MDHTSQLDKTGSQPKAKRTLSLQNVLNKVNKEMYKRNYELAQTNRTLNLLRSIDNIALATHESLNVFCYKLSEAIVKTAEFTFAGVVTNPISPHHVATYSGFAAANGLTDGQVEQLNKMAIDKYAHWYQSQRRVHVAKASGLFENGLTVQPKVKDQLVETLDIVTDIAGVETMLLIKLSSSQKVVGVMAIGFHQAASTIGESDLDLITRLADSIGVALESKLLFEENQLVVDQLKKANEKLKALDETKDDFISMASHQLRTPLTSVKGYLSMVLEGDAGDISKVQRDMIGQAFFSAQRMVYLIADLLNVSRLRTGKFVIERSPVNLATIVRQEISQLQETAASKSLNLTYDQPKEFPDLNLDETKTRQVIMNYVDNAIYYTPAGGEIHVSLADNPSSVELKVIDNGIGVPKEEQHHLFTKFYRAGNARKARPDGTGLGLFMAKKVVAAEGGSIIFESSEGKGSTFGFVFSKSKLKPKNAEAIPVKAEAKETANI